MDLATLVGLIGTCIVVGTAIVLGGSVTAFVDTASIVLVIGGTLLVTLMKFSFPPVRERHEGRDQSVHLSRAGARGADRLVDRISRTKRAPAACSRSRTPTCPDEFFRKALNLVVDGHDPGVVRSILTKDLELTLKRHRDGQAIFKAIGDAAPAMGMIGTLIGLVQMLGAMSDPKQIAPAMAIALLTTLYGAMIANVIAIPIADKLALRSTDERLAKSLIIDAVMSIQDGQHPRVMQDLLEELPAEVAAHRGTAGGLSPACP